MRVIIAGGGTGGHVFPAIALAEQLIAEHPNKAEVLFVGSDDGLEQRAVPEAGFALETLKAGKLKGARLLGRLRTLAGLGPNALRALGLLRRFHPDVIVGVGGYASAPVVLAAALSGRRQRVVLLEQNAVPGTVNRWLAVGAHRVVISYAESARYFAAGKTLLLGNPLRPALVAKLKALPPRVVDPGRPLLLVLGGSQGARRINELVAEALPTLREAVPGLRLIHQTGAADHAGLARRYEGDPDAEAVAFIGDVASAYGAADLVLGRSGATTMAEVAMAGKPALLIPYPFAADDHQTRNAEALVAAGAARMVPQQRLDAPVLAAMLGELLGDAELLERMGAAMRGCARPEAGHAIVELLCQIAAS